jgi:hypothetical protein
VLNTPLFPKIFHDKKPMLCISSKKTGRNRTLISDLRKKCQACPIGQTTGSIKRVFDPFDDNAGRECPLALNPATEHLIPTTITDEGGRLKMKCPFPGVSQYGSGAVGDDLPLDF